MKQLLKQFGLNQKESQAFLRLLELGAQPVSVIAKHMGTPRSSMYLVVDRLKESQLIETFDRAGIKYVKAIPAKSIIDILKAKKAQIQQTSELLAEKLPELEALENKLSVTPHVRFFERRPEVMKMYESVLSEKGFCTIFNPQKVMKNMPEYHLKIPEAIHHNKLKVRELLVDCKEGRDYKKKFSSKNHQIKLLPKEMNFDSDTIICSDKIYMISYGSENMSATQIINRSLAETQQVLFDQLWKIV